MTHTTRWTGHWYSFLLIMSLALPGLAADPVAVRDTHLGDIADSTWAAAKAVGITQLEVAVEPDLTCSHLREGDATPYRIDTPEHRKQLLEAARKNGCSIIGFATVVLFPKDTNDAERVAWITKVTEAAVEMNVPIILMPLVAQDLDEATFVKRATVFLKTLGPVAKQHKVQLVVENLGPYLNKREVLKPLMEAVPDDQVGLGLDIANMYWFGHPLDTIYKLAKTFAPHVRYAHAKNIKYPEELRNKQREMGFEYMKRAEPVKTGDIDFNKVLGYYYDAGFNGYVTIEDASLGKFDADGKKKALTEDATFLRSVIAAQRPAAPDTTPPRVRFDTSLGSFVIELYPAKTPVTVANFLRYVDEKFYDGTIFHRIGETFMIQGGGFTDLQTRKTDGLHDPIVNEAKKGLKNEAGTIAMARTQDPNSATSQFFINVTDNPALNPGWRGAGYCAFGRVVEGMDTVDAIRTVETRRNPMMPREKTQPVDPPVILSARRVK